jgi:hypothetical protein
VLRETSMLCSELLSGDGHAALGDAGSTHRCALVEVQNMSPDEILRQTAALGREITKYADVIEATLQQARERGTALKLEDDATVQQLARTGVLGTQLESVRDALAELSAALYEQGISLKEEAQGSSMNDDSQGVSMIDYYQRVRMTGDDV